MKQGLQGEAISFVKGIDMVVGFGLYKLMGEKSTEATRYLETLCGQSLKHRWCCLTE